MSQIVQETCAALDILTCNKYSAIQIEKHGQGKPYVLTCITICPNKIKVTCYRYGA